MKIGIIQQHNSADINANRENLARKARKLAAAGAALIVNQELHDGLYFCQTESVDNFDQAVDLQSEATKFYADLAKELGVVIVTSMFERRARGCITIRQSYLKKMVLKPEDTARCISLMIRHITKNFISPR